MLCYEREYPHNLNFCPTVTMEIKDNVFSRRILFAKNDCAYVFAVVIWDIEIYTFDGMTFADKLSRTDGIDVVGILVRSDYSSPGTFIGLFKLLHQ
jgi:hypothetical protein